MQDNQDIKIVFFGASTALANRMDYLSDVGINPDYICDNNTNKYNTFFKKIIIYDPTSVFNLDHQYIVLITSSYFKEIRVQLEQYNNIIQIVNFDEIDYFINSYSYEDNILSNFINARKSKRYSLSNFLFDDDFEALPKITKSLKDNLYADVKQKRLTLEIAFSHTNKGLKNE